MSPVYKRKVMIKGGGCVKPRCLNVISIRKVMIIGGGCVKPRCLNVTSMRKVMIIGWMHGCVKYEKFSSKVDGSVNV